MASNFLPFLYQTRTLQRSVKVPVSFIFAHRFYATQQRQRRSNPKNDHSIPFELDEEDQHLTMGDPEGGPGQSSTITPSEAEVFKGIFDEIAQGRMPKARKRHAAAATVSKDPSDIELGEGLEILRKKVDLAANEQLNEGVKSIVDQFRTTDSRDEFLQRYPVSLRQAAETALGKFELEPLSAKVADTTELDEEEARKQKEWARYMEIQEAEKERVGALMRGCQTDAALWDLMEAEVFSLPAKLGILQEPAAMLRVRKTTRPASKKGGSVPKTDAIAAEPASTKDERLSMDIHGPLYPHYLTLGLDLFATAFSRPSMSAFRILPKVKALGLPSYVLGVTTPFYLRLAEMHWNHFGDAVSAFDMLEEMASLGLSANEEMAALLVRIRDDLHGCTWGAQGPFVMAMMEAAPYDTALMHRLEAAEKYVRRSFALQNRN